MTNIRSIPPALRERFKTIQRLTTFEDKRSAIQELGALADPDSDLLLLYFTDDRSRDVRLVALEELWDNASPLARIAARACLGDSWHIVRDTAAEALGDVGTSQDVSRLILALQDQEWMVRCSAASSLGFLGGTRSRKALLSGLSNDSHPNVRRYIAGAFHVMNDPSVIPALEIALNREKEDYARSGLLYAIYTLGQPERLSPLLQLLQSEDPTLQFQVLNCLREGISPSDRETVFAALRDVLRSDAVEGVKTDAEDVMSSLESNGKDEES